MIEQIPQAKPAKVEFTINLKLVNFSVKIPFKLDEESFNKTFSNIEFTSDHYNHEGYAKLIFVKII